MKQLILDKLLSRERKFYPIHRGLFEGCEMNLSLRYQFHVRLGTYEREISPAFAELAKGARLFLDIGAAEGYYSSYMLQQTDARVLAFEPDSEAAEILFQNLARNTRNGHRIQVIERFVGAVESEISTTIDRAVQGAEGPIFLKIDVEGGEADVLRGAAAILNRHRTRVIVETHGIAVEKECIAILESHGFDLEIVDPAWWRTILKEGRSGEHNRWIVARPIEGLTS